MAGGGPCGVVKFRVGEDCSAVPITKYLLCSKEAAAAAHSLAKVLYVSQSPWTGRQSVAEVK